MYFAMENYFENSGEVFEEIKVEEKGLMEVVTRAEVVVVAINIEIVKLIVVVGLVVVEVSLLFVAKEKA